MTEGRTWSIKQNKIPAISMQREPTSTQKHSECPLDGDSFSM